MNTTSVDRFENPKAEMTIYMTQAFHERAGRTPEETAVHWLSTACELAELNYDIHYGFAPQDMPEPTGSCAEPWETWRSTVNDGNVEHVAKDSNILLLDRTGGGCGAGLMCTVGVAPWGDEFRAYRLGGPGDVAGVGNALLHEVAHNFSYSHAPGRGFGMNDHDNEQWLRTPTTNNDMENKCGEFMEAREYDADYEFAFWHWCAVDTFDIEGTTDTCTPPTTYPPQYQGSKPYMADQIPTPPDPADYVDFESLSFSGGQNQATVDYRITNNSDDPIKATVRLTAGDSEQIRTHEMQGNHTPPEESVTLDVPVGSPTDVEVCCEIDQADYNR